MSKKTFIKILISVIIVVLVMALTIFLLTLIDQPGKDSPTQTDEQLTTSQDHTGQELMNKAAEASEKGNLDEAKAFYNNAKSYYEKQESVEAQSKLGEIDASLSLIEHQQKNQLPDVEQPLAGTQQRAN